MGCFGYICKGCYTPINGDCFDGGENAILIHVRHGKEVGRTQGHYDEYGGVIEEENLPEEQKFRGDQDGINGHNEICKSEFDLEDSIYANEDKKLDNYSGIAAWHVKCYEEASDRKRNNLKPSKSDPNQSWGKVRDRFK